MESFETKTNRRRLDRRVLDKSPAVAFFLPIEEESEITMFSTANRALTFPREHARCQGATRSTWGVQTMVLRGKHRDPRLPHGGRTSLLTSRRATRCRSIRPSAHC